ncbi:putative tail fiber assembly protein [Yersinia aldovae]|uniref:tail fiber assembly protein n=1 Tax=Yersinia aldovae TaxID=29483 RepID=UPI0005E4F1C9|nr:tail fiber assembly protein [Yersinia aldovae]CNK29108.1 putative tail fiber assembly protein [Yersinia aldovae]
MYCFSAKKCCFYPSELLSVYAKAGTLPDDLVDIDDDIYIQFTQRPPMGKMRGTDNKGMPVWIDIPASPALTHDELATMARCYRDEFIAATDRLMISDYCINDEPLAEYQRNELMTTRAAYRTWPTSFGWPLIELPELPQWLLIEAVNQGYRVPVWPI